MSALFPNQVIVSAHLTEKASLVGQYANTYVFKVASKATKLEIKKAVENKFNVTVTKVNLLNVKGKMKRGGKGKTGISTRAEDFVVQIFTANTHTPVLFFSTQGLVYKIKAHKIPEGTAASKGKSIFNILPLKSHHSISSIMPLPEDESEWKNLMVVFATAKGNIRKNTLEVYQVFPFYRIQPAFFLPNLYSKTF